MTRSVSARIGYGFWQSRMGASGWGTGTGRQVDHSVVYDNEVMDFEHIALRLARIHLTRRD